MTSKVCCHRRQSFPSHFCGILFQNHGTSDNIKKHLRKRENEKTLEIDAKAGFELLHLLENGTEKASENRHCEEHSSSLVRYSTGYQAALPPLIIRIQELYACMPPFSTILLITILIPRYDLAEHGFIQGICAGNVHLKPKEEERPNSRPTPVCLPLYAATTGLGLGVPSIPSEDAWVAATELGTGG